MVTCIALFFFVIFDKSRTKAILPLLSPVAMPVAMLSLQQFLEGLPKTRESRQYFSNLMLMRLSGSPNSFGRYGAKVPANPRFWHTEVKTYYDIFDVDFSESCSEVKCLRDIEIDDKPLLCLLIVLNPTIIDHELKCIAMGVIKCNDMKYNPNDYRPILCHYIGKEDTLEMVQELKEYRSPHLIRNSFVQHYEIAYLKDEFDSHEKNPRQNNNEMEFCYDIHKGNYRNYIDNGEADFVLFPVDHDIPEIARSDPMLLMMFTKATSDEILECIKTHAHSEEVIVQIIIPRLLLYRTDVNVELKTIDGLGVVEVTIRSSGNQIIISDEDGIGDLSTIFPSTYTALSQRLSAVDVSFINELGGSKNPVCDLTLNDVFTGTKVIIAESYLPFSINTDGKTYFGDFRNDAGMVQEIRHHKKCLKFMIESHRLVKLLKKGLQGRISRDIFEAIIELCLCKNALVELRAM